MDLDLLTSPELAHLLGCTPADIKNWRRLPADHRRHLPSTVRGGRHYYTPADVVEWLVRNPRRLATALFDQAERQALPRAIASTIAHDLRGDPLPEPADQPEPACPDQPAPTGNHWWDTTDNFYSKENQQ